MICPKIALNAERDLFLNLLQEDLIKTKDGDDEAFARLLDTYTPMITSLVSEFSKAYPSVDMNEDDLRQEAAIALYFSALSYKPERGVSFGLYAKICTKNRLLSYMQRSITRSLSQMISDCIDDCFEDEPASDEEQPLNLIISKENSDLLRSRIKQYLTDYEYRVFMMYADGMSPSAIARTMGKNVKSVYNTLQRVRKKLRKIV